jgi:hypothetical protein
MILVVAMAAAIAGQAPAAPPAPDVATQAPTAAPPQPSTTVAPVTITPLVKESDLARARNFIDSYAAPTARLDRYARWNDPPCALVVGLAPAQAAAIKARVEEVARSAGLKVGGAGCRTNVEIEFTAQPQALVDQIVAKTPQVLGFQPSLDPKALKTVTRPIQAWYMTASRGGANALAPWNAQDVIPRLDLGAPNPGTTTSANHLSPNAAQWAATNHIEEANGARQLTPPPILSTPETLDGPYGGSAAGCDPRALAGQGLVLRGLDSEPPACQSVFRNVLVVVDIGRVQDHSVQSLTDYVAMLALSQPRSLDGCMALASIIDLLAPAPCPGRDAPDGLTPADTAYLGALYASDPQANITMQQSAMSERMARAMAKAAEAKAP